MNSFFLILFKTAIFVISYIAVSKIMLNFFKRRNVNADFRDIEIVVVSVVSSAVITSVFRLIFKLFI